MYRTMEAYCYWLILLLVAPEFVRGESPPVENEGCELNWVAYRDSCYRIIQHTLSVPAKSWEDARAYCRVLDGDLVSIGTREEGRFLERQLSLYERTAFWLGLYRNSSGEIADEGWVWMDGTALNYEKWGWKEPNNWENNERCGEIYASTGFWNDISCSQPRSAICERENGVPTPTVRIPHITTAKPEVVCEVGWKPFRKSCYKISDVKRPWRAAKRDCGDLGGHLLKIDDQVEQNYFYNQVWNLWHSRFWIGLNDPQGNGTWQWESNSSSLQYTNWYDGEPNGVGTERCVEMYAGRLAAFWNDHYCYTNTKYICEKEGGKSGCPDDWTLYGDNCYQFNLAESQFKNWTVAKQACESIGDFSSLVSIQNESENAFLTKEISSVAKSAVWIGLNDRQSENVFKWSDSSKADYRNWIQKNSRNRPWKDCTVLMGMRTDGAWTTELCSAPRRYICKRKKAMFNCDAPLGMENGNINDDQITAKILSPSTGPLKSRLRSDGAWCPQAKDDYLQIDLGSIYKIKNIAVQGLATSYCIQYGKDGKAYKPYGPRTSECEELSSEASAEPHFLKNLRPFIARYIRITPTQGSNKCVRLEFYGCLSENSVIEGFRRTTWLKIPSSAYQIQINHVVHSWTVARSYCLEQNADLLSVSTAAIAEYIKRRLNRLRPYSWWIGLTDRDYPLMYYWTDASPVNYIGWGGYVSRYNANGCVYYRKYQSSWSATSCNERKPFVCMRKDPNAPTYNAVKRLSVGVVGNGVTGVWMSSATHYWPLSNVDNGNISGTVDGRAFGNIKIITGVKDKPDSALQFSKSGMYIDVPFEAQDCLTFPDTCPSKQLTLSFMASFDATAANWHKVAILDSLGGNEQNSTGISVTIDQKKLVFVVSYVDQFWRVSIPIEGDGVWRHYVMACSQIVIQVFVNGKSANSRAYAPNLRKTIHSKNLKRNFHIGLQTNSKVSSGALNLTMLAFWEGLLPDKDIRAIYKTEFGWCPNGWVAFGMSCYEFTTGGSSWEVARSRCQILGGDLVTISTPVEQALITRQIKTTSWIGLTGIMETQMDIQRRNGPHGVRIFRRSTNKLNFIWQNRSPAVYTNWQSHTGFSYRGARTCVCALGSSGSWAQYACTSSPQCICEKEKDETKAAFNTTVVDFPKFTRACQYSRAFLSCPSGSVIKIQRGFWGRKQRKLCRFVSIIDCGLDTEPAITDKLRKLCDGSSSCKVEASNDPKHLGNPCIGIYKYLEVNYTCVLKENVKHPCSPGWVRSKHDGIACYRLIQSKKSWSDSEKTCKGYGAKLISIRDKSEQALATSLMERAWNADVWIGLSDENTPNTFKWSDGTPVSWINWAVGNPRGAWTGNHCVYMNLERTKKELMYWRGGKCGENKLFICKKMITPPSPTTTPKTGGSCSFGWTLFKNNCYKYYNYRRSWKQAQSYCHPRFTGTGNLASITSKEENDFIANLANTTIWIGLEGRGVYRGHAWSDRTPVSYTNWDVGQPDSYNGREACTQLYADIGYWSDVNCYSSKPFVCKRKMISGTGPRPTVTPTIVQSSRCKEDWYLFNNMCYMISNSSNYKSWHEAETSCTLMGGHLASVTSNEEKDFVSQLIRPTFVYSFWIGLHDVGGESLYKWTDGTGYGKFIYWRNGEPNNFHGQEDCVSIVRTDGKWNDNHCSQKKSYICKSKTEDAPKITVLKPASKVGKNGYCAPGWVPNGQYCYEFHTDESDYKTWRDAKNTCEKGTNSSAIGELVSITNEIEQAFITLNLKGSKTPLWIGMNNFHDYRSYFWADSSPANFYHWNKGQPSLFPNRCVEISPFRKNAGKWSSTPCHSKKGYICKTAAKSTPVVPATPIPTAVNPHTTESPSFKCSKEYIQYDESCYMFVNSPKTFDEARDACRKGSAELISVDSEFEQALLVFLMERNLGTVWIGLSKEPWSALKFTDHSAPHYSYWGPGQPNRPLDQRTCVLANVTGYHVGRWYDVDCHMKNPYVCEIYHGESKITLEENTTCQAGWQKYRKNCYKHFQQSKSWPAARYICQNNGGDLVSIADDLEQDFAMFYFSNKPRIWLWIGLHDRGSEGGYEWSDDSPLTYVNWMRNQPNDVGQSQNCVIMDSRDGRWYDWRCGAPYAFVCKKPLECSSKILLNKEMITVSNDIAVDFSVEQAILKANSPENSTWCPNTTTGIQPRIQIDLYDLVKISSITTKGRMLGGEFVQVHQFVKSFLVVYTTDGYTWQTYSRRGINVKLFANYDGTTPVTKTFSPPIVASSIAILPTVIEGEQPCMKLSLQGCDFVCLAELGMNNWKIPGNSITASSAKYPMNAPQNARPRSEGWCAKINDKKQWIQVNFGRTNLVTKIRTFGDTKDSYVERYKIQISGDGIEWVDYKQNGGVRIFKGNLHAAHPVTHTLTDASQAQYIRIVPLSWKNNICMRFELFGCAADCDGPLIQKGNNEISDVKLTSSDPKSNPEYARMDSGKAWCTSAKFEKYLEVDFGKAVRLKNIATKGSPSKYGEPRRVVTYTLGFYRNNKWKKYMLDNSVKYIVAGNVNDSTTLSKYSFPASLRDGNGVIVRKVRIYPKEFTPAGICMRVEFYGCLAEAEIIPTTPPTTQQTLQASIRITSMEWNNNLKDKTSKEFKKASTLIIKSVTDVYENNDDSQEGEALREVKVKKLREGSVIADLLLVFNPRFAKNENISKPLMDAISNGNIGQLKVDKSYIHIKENPEGSPVGKSENNGLSNGTIAGVVVAVLLVLLLVVGIGIYWRQKRKRDLYGPKQFNNPILYSTANTDEFEVE